MNSIWTSLLWKEYREHRWKMAALVAIMLVVPVILSIQTPGNIFGSVVATLMMAVPLSAMFVGMSAAAGEQSRGTIHFLQSLPTSMVRPATAKLAWAVLTLIAPVAAAVVGAALWSRLFVGRTVDEDLRLANAMFPPPWGLTDWYATVLVSGSLAGVSFMTWVAAFGVNRSDEVRAGAVGLLAVLCYWAALTWIASQAESSAAVDRLKVLLAAAPGGAIAVAGPAARFAGQDVALDGSRWWAYFWPYATAALASHVALLAVYLARFGRVAPARVQTDETLGLAAKSHSWLAPPRRSPLAAIVWKQLRETAPLGLMGAAVVILAGVWAASGNRDHDVAGLTAGIWFLVGAFVATVAGVGLVMDDLRPQIHAFWRSRPISVRQWFVVKFAIGVVTTTALLAVPIVLLLALVSMSREDTLSMVGAGLLVQLGLFAAGVAAMALVRQAVYAAILAMGITAVYAITVSAIFEVMGWHQQLVAIIVAYLAGIAGLIFVAWLAVRNDWGWKG